MKEASEPQIKDFHDKDHTCITFKPDLNKFNIDKLDKDTVALLTRRAFDIAGSVRGLEVYLNKEKIKVHAVYLAHALSLSLSLSLSLQCPSPAGNQLHGDRQTAVSTFTLRHKLLEISTNSVGAGYIFFRLLSL